MTTSFNATKDQIGYYVAQAASGTPDIQVVLLQSTGLVADAAMADYGTLADVLAGTSDEATFTNYVRKTLASPTRTVDNTGDRVLLGGAAVGVAHAITWVAAGGAANNTLGKVLFVYAPTSGSADSAILPLMATDITATTDGNDLVLTLSTDGFAIVSNP